jgi:hypothetical protein
MQDELQLTLSTCRVLRAATQGLLVVRTRALACGVLVPTRLAAGAMETKAVVAKHQMQSKAATSKRISQTSTPTRCLKNLRCKTKLCNSAGAQLSTHLQQQISLQVRWWQQ